MIMDYKAAGVDIEEGYKAVDRYRDLSAGTLRNGSLRRAVINEIGSFAGMFSLREIIAAGRGMADPVLVSGTDGVGTKLDIAFRMGVYGTVGIDCVAMCVNDILCHGARPLFFLDYLACGKLDAEIAAEMVKGVALACRETDCVLLGGETAEMPGFYDEGKYDIAGFAVGIVDRADIIDGREIRDGDLLVGLASSGPHSNGFSLIRKVLPDLDEDFGGMPIGRALLEPTRLYVKPVLALRDQVRIHGLAHVTGGGFYENIPRMFAEPHDAVIVDGSWRIPPLFARIAYGMATTRADGSAGKPTDGALAEAEGRRLLADDPELQRRLFNTFNMGVGLVLALAPEDAEKAIAFLDAQGFPAFKIGRVAPSVPADAADAADSAAGRGGKNPGLGAVRFVRE